MSDRSLPAPDGRSIRAAIESHLGSRQVPRVIYGSMIGLALVLVLEAHPPTAGEAVALLLTTAVAVALAELYSDIIGTETRTRHRIRRADVAPLLGDAVAVAFGAAAPAIFVVLAAIGAIELDTALTLAKWSGLALIAAYGFVAARYAGAGVASALFHALAVAAVGGLLIVVKALVH
jgi:hypothetical protein